MADGSLVAFGEAAGDETAEGEAVGLHARGGEKHDLVASLHVAGDALRFGLDFANGGTGKHDGVGIDDTAERGRLAAAPDRAGLAAALGPAGDERLHAGGVGEPGGLADGGVHGDGDRQGAAGHEVVDDGGDGINRDGVVKVFAGLRIDGVGDEILGAEALLDVGEEVVGGLHEVAALAASVGGLGVTVALEEGRGGLGGLLAGALEGIELIVVNAGGFVGQRHEEKAENLTAKNAKGREG